MSSTRIGFDAVAGRAARHWRPPCGGPLCPRRSRTHRSGRHHDGHDGRNRGRAPGGGDLAVDQVVWAEYEAGILVVAGTLKTNVLIEKDHAVTAAKRDVAHRLKDTTRKAAGKVFPEAAFTNDTLDGKKLWSAISGGTKAKN
ncbi:MAG: hypothetical protein K0S65_5352 [Labilithrix sp.]|nr:hypothetical protein [Labilithrix sp.]